MKFSDLSRQERATLAALRASAGSNMNTEQLGRAMHPQMSPANAANVLNGMRKQGLVYSMQKAVTTAYAPWVISEYGIAVFDGRPDTDPAMASPSTQGPNMAAVEKKAPAKQFIVGAIGYYSRKFTCKGYALEAAQISATANPGLEYSVYELIAVANMPVPQAQITLL